LHQVRRMTNVLVLGADGMLGSMVARVLSTNAALNVVRSTRLGAHHNLAFDATQHSVGELFDEARCDWIINTIGILDRDIDETDPDSVAAAIDVNSSFPHRLAASVGRGRRVLHISTDGVFSGRNAPYDESAPHDAAGVYARTKSLGEPQSANCVTLRCSIVGPERSPGKSLLGWILSQPPGAIITGRTNHRWNGVTTLHLAQLCAALILAEYSNLPSVLHVVPGDTVSKSELIELCIRAFGRSDLTVAAQPAAVPLDRTLRTVHPEINQRLWAAAGHAVPPTIGEMVEELAATCS
jgi:dTDP-4-dehydrorhamnose reductase